MFQLNFENPPEGAGDEGNFKIANGILWKK